MEVIRFYICNTLPGSAIAQLFLIRDAGWVFLTGLFVMKLKISEVRRRPVNIFAQRYKTMAFSSNPDYLQWEMDTYSCEAVQWLEWTQALVWQ